MTQEARMAWICVFISELGHNLFGKQCHFDKWFDYEMLVDTHMFMCVFVVREQILKCIILISWINYWYISSKLRINAVTCGEGMTANILNIPFCFDVTLLIFSLLLYFMFSCLLSGGISDIILIIGLINKTRIFNVFIYSVHRLLHFLSE